MVVVLSMLVLVFCGTGCKGDKPPKTATKITTKTAEENKSLPRLHADEIITVISDSGVTRYRIYTKQWDVYDTPPEPYWDFPKGIHFERFNEDLVVDANIHANKARYFDQKKLWELQGKVRAINIQGEMFESERLYWNSAEQRIYSDTVVKITQQKRIFTAINFNSNESLTRYNFQQLKGEIAIEDE